MKSKWPNTEDAWTVLGISVFIELFFVGYVEAHSVVCEPESSHQSEPIKLGLKMFIFLPCYLCLRFHIVECLAVEHYSFPRLSGQVKEKLPEYPQERLNLLLPDLMKLLYKLPTILRYLL